MPQSAIVSNYLALSQSSSRTDVLTALQNIAEAPIDALSAEDKELLVQALINDVKDGKGRITQKDTALAITALKTLGRNPTSSRVIIKRENLQAVFHLGTDTRDQNLEAAQEAIRCIANALLLIDTGRDTLLDMGGGDTCLGMLERANNPQAIFLASRILFLLTVKASPFIKRLVEELHIVEIIPPKLDLLMTSLLSSQPMASEAMTDILKFGFNVVRQYPRMIQSGATDDAWSEKLDNLLPPLLRLFNGLPPTFPSPLVPPLTHVIHNLIMIPVAPLAVRWFSSPSSTLRSTHPEKLQKAFSALTSGRRSLSSSRSSSPSPALSPQHDTVQRAWDLFEITTAHYVPEDPDDPSVRQLCRREAVVLDDLLAPLVILLSRFAAADVPARHRMKAWILPADLDRTSPLEKRGDLLGRCLRLMSCVYFPQTKDTVGELLYNICDSDASTLAGQVGYGNCAGLLFNKGIMAPPSSVTDAEGELINPMTGIRHSEQPFDDEMTEEEKEREAEKLFVLFDRLEKRGMAVNPVRKALQGG